VCIEVPGQAGQSRVKQIHGALLQEVLYEKLKNYDFGCMPTAWKRR
jgi:hypothetical protein